MREIEIYEAFTLVRDKHFALLRNKVLQAINDELAPLDEVQPSLLIQVQLYLLGELKKTRVLQDLRLRLDTKEEKLMLSALSEAFLYRLHSTLFYFSAMELVKAMNVEGTTSRQRRAMMKKRYADFKPVASIIQQYKNQMQQIGRTGEMFEGLAREHWGALESYGLGMQLSGPELTRISLEIGTVAQLLKALKDTTPLKDGADRL